MQTLEQTSAGGVAFRPGATGIEIALIAVGPQRRWQLPKGRVDPGETPEMTAVREVREEAGIETDLVATIETINYWFVGNYSGERVRFHKHVHFFLLAYSSGEVTDHDHEVQEARWVPVEEAPGMLAFKAERQVVEKARELLNQPKP